MPDTSNSTEIKYLNSADVTVFPSGFRGAKYNKSKFTTEDNLIRFAQMSVNKNNNNQCYQDPYNANNIIIYLKGYYFNVQVNKLPVLTPMYAFIQLVDKGDQVGYVLDKAELSNSTQVSSIASPVTLDDTVNDTSNTSKFLGLGFTNNITDDLADVYYVQVRDAQGKLTDQKLKLDTSEIRDVSGDVNNNSNSIDKVFTTERLSVRKSEDAATTVSPTDVVTSNITANNVVITDATVNTIKTNTITRKDENNPVLFDHSINFKTSDGTSNNSSPVRINKPVTIESELQIGGALDEEVRNTGKVTIKSGGASNTVIIGPENGTINLPPNSSGNKVFVQNDGESDWVDYSADATKSGSIVRRDETCINTQTLNINGAIISNTVINNSDTDPNKDIDRFEINNGKSNDKAVFLRNSGTFNNTNTLDNQGPFNNTGSIEIKNDASSNPYIKITKGNAELNIKNAKLDIEKAVDIDAPFNVGSDQACGAVNITSAGDQPTTIVGPIHFKDSAENNDKDASGEVYLPNSADIPVESTDDDNVDESRYQYIWAQKRKIEKARTTTENGEDEVKVDVTYPNDWIPVSKSWSSDNDNTTIVQRDNNGNIAAKTFNNVKITKTLDDDVTATINKDLTINAPLTIGDAEKTGDVTIKSAGTQPTTIIGPNAEQINLPKNYTISDLIPIKWTIPASSSTDRIIPKINSTIIPADYDKYFTFNLVDDTETYDIGVKRAEHVDIPVELPAELIIPSTYNDKAVTIIREGAFTGCNTLENVIIPDSITSIGSNAFTDCMKLTDITLGNAVTNISSYAFGSCRKLTHVLVGSMVTAIGENIFIDSYNNVPIEIYYAGTEEEWKRISVKSELNDATKYKTYFYSETEPALNSNSMAYTGNYWHYVTENQSTASMHTVAFTQDGHGNSNWLQIAKASNQLDTLVQRDGLDIKSKTFNGVKINNRQGSTEIISDGGNNDSTALKITDAVNVTIDQEGISLNFQPNAAGVGEKTNKIIFPTDFSAGESIVSLPRREDIGKQNIEHIWTQKKTSSGSYTDNWRPTTITPGPTSDAANAIAMTDSQGNLRATLIEASSTQSEAKGEFPLFFGDCAKNFVAVQYLNLQDKKIVASLPDGRITANSFNALSDARLKENFKTYTPEKSILDLPIYKFDFIKGAKNQLGCKAQDLQEICPEIVDENNDGYLSIKESKIVYLLIDEVKKLKAEIEELKKNK